MTKIDKFDELLLNTIFTETCTTKRLQESYNVNDEIVH